MRKNWNKPEVKQLSVKMTEASPIKTGKIDAEYTDPATDNYYWSES